MNKTLKIITPAELLRPDHTPGPLKLVRQAKPFLKWAGGKSQLIPDIERLLPEPIRQSGTIERYIEPFIGGGAFFFHLKNKYHIRESFIFDINPELILTYQVIQREPQALLVELSRLRREFHQQENQAQRDALFYHNRDLFNRQRAEMNYKRFNASWIQRAALLVFLNKTCFNGLFRLNRAGGFNVPFGQYKKPEIFTEKSIMEAHAALQNTRIQCGDFRVSKKFAAPGALIYLDPPYRPLTKTSNFTDYSMQGFTDDDQWRLARYFRDMDRKEAFLILSNSDPRNADQHDHFFDTMYKGFHIMRVRAYRSINCISALRGKINEIIVSNIPPPPDPLLSTGAESPEKPTDRPCPETQTEAAEGPAV